MRSASQGGRERSPAATCVQPANGAGGGGMGDERLSALYFLSYTCMRLSTWCAGYIQGMRKREAGTWGGIRVFVGWVGSPNFWLLPFDRCALGRLNWPLGAGTDGVVDDFAV